MARRTEVILWGLQKTAAMADHNSDVGAMLLHKRQLAEQPLKSRLVAIGGPAAAVGAIGGTLGGILGSVGDRRSGLLGAGIGALAGAGLGALAGKIDRDYHIAAINEARRAAGE